MRLISWNCQGAFKRKHSHISTLRPDILVVPECESLDGITVDLGTEPVRSLVWKGDNPNKGIGIFSYGDYSVSLHEAYNPRFRLIVPLEVTGPASFVLMAVWTLPDKATGSYVLPLLSAYEYYREKLRGRTVIWTGDFNASVRFDPKLKHHKFSEFLGMTEADQLQSMYHRRWACAHGDEPEGTFFLYRHADKRHHIDFAFADKEFLDAGFDIVTGAYQDWKNQSDHMPLICDFHALKSEAC